MKAEIETFYPKSRTHWRNWLKKNHLKKDSIWLICYKKKTDMPTVGWSEAVDEALCFGWIDSQRISIDEEKFRQYFCKRKPRSAWSRINKEKVKRLIKDGLMSEAGLGAIAIAKENGSWTTLDEVEELHIPADLNKHFRTQPDARKFFVGLSKSNKRNILQWITLARRPETRQKRIHEVVELAGQGLKPKQFR